MKRVVVVLLLMTGLFASISAQSGRRVTVRAETPPDPTAAMSNSSGVSDSIPINKQSPRQPNLHGGVLPVPSSDQTQNKTSDGATNTGEAVGDDDVVRVDTQLVTIPVSIIDRQGNFVAGLEQENFHIFEDGKEQQVAYFSTTEQPFTVVLMLDVSPSTEFKIDEIQQAAIEFVHQLKENDRVMVIAFDQSTHVLTEPTTDRDKIAKTIRRANFGEGTSIYDAVDYVIRRRLNKIEGRKAVVLFSDGVDTSSIRSSYEKTVRESEEIDAAFYTVYYNTFFDMQGRGSGGSIPQYPPQSGGGIGGVIGIILGGGRNGGNYPGSGGGTQRGDAAHGEMYLKDLADKTGGRKYDAATTANLQTAFYNIAEELRRKYSIGYYQNETGNAGERKQIKVRVDRPNLVVRARDSYVVGASDKPSNTAATPPKVSFQNTKAER